MKFALDKTFYLENEIVVIRKIIKAISVVNKTDQI